MRIRILLFTVLFSVLAWLSWGVNLNFTPTITLTALTSTSVRIQLAGLRATGIDTIKVYSAASDSDAVTTSSAGARYWFQALVSKDTTVAGLAPGTTFIWKVRADSAGTYRTSVPDTVVMYNPQIDELISSEIKEDFRSMFTAAAWPKTPSYSSTFTISGTGKDSTMVYEVWPYTGIAFYAVSGATDSTQVKFICRAGYGQPTIGGLFLYTSVDSLTITAKGTYVRSWAIPSGCKYFYVTMAGQTGNAYATSITPYVRRVRF